MKKLLTILLVSVLGLQMMSAQSIDYYPIATQITANASTKMQKVKAIYDWLCKNIAYDTDYEIYHADECYRQRKGVCQAYCELMQCMCREVGVECIIVVGTAKQISGDMQKSNHSWLYVEVEKGGILIDPTWGAGSVNNGVFTRNDDTSSWFDVNPYWMIFSHLPDNSRYQGIETPIDFNTFAMLPGLRPVCRYLGWDPKKIFTQYLNKTITSIPKMYTIHKDRILHLVNIPMQRVLDANQTYRFEVENPKGLKFGIVANNTIYSSSEWNKTGDRYWIDIKPSKDDDLLISICEGDGVYTALLKYAVSHSNGNDGTPLKNQVPPEIYDAGTDAVKLLNVPKYGILSIGQNYHFEVENPTHRDIALEYNGKWYKTSVWKHSGSKYWIDLNMTEPGSINILVKTEGNMYNYMIHYNVE